MTEQIQKLKASFKRKVVDQNEDVGNNNSSAEYYEFNDPNDVECWSLNSYW
jgi:hypothetical protein